MVSTRTGATATEQEGRDRQNPTQPPSSNQANTTHSDSTGLVTRQEFQVLLQELTQSRKQLAEQLRANIELTNQLNRWGHRRSRRDDASRASTESSASSDYHHRTTRPRLEGSHAQAAEYQPALTVGQLRVGPSASFQTGPSTRGGTAPTVHYCPTVHHG